MTTTWNSDEALFRLSVANLAKTAPVAPDEERRLLLALHNGKAAKKILRKKLPKSAKKLAELKAQVEQSEKARDKLIIANGRLVISIANHYTGHGLSLAEVSQEGVLGLIRAIDKFDPNKGIRLSTYASYWIRQSVTRAVAMQTRTIRLPVHKVDHIARIRKMINQLTQELGRVPDMSEVADMLDEPQEKLEALLNYSQETISLEDPIGDDGATLADFVVEEEGDSNLETTIDKTLLEEEIENALATLTARESRIMMLRYGLRDGHPLTLQDVAERFGLTRERIRQIEKEAIDKLRQAEKAFKLRAFI